MKSALILNGMIWPTFCRSFRRWRSIHFVSSNFYIFSDHESTFFQLHSKIKNWNFTIFFRKQFCCWQVDFNADLIHNSCLQMLTVNNLAETYFRTNCQCPIILSKRFGEIKFEQVFVSQLWHLLKFHEYFSTLSFCWPVWSLSRSSILSSRKTWAKQSRLISLSSFCSTAQPPPWVNFIKLECTA